MRSGRHRALPSEGKNIQDWATLREFEPGISTFKSVPEKYTIQLLHHTETIEKILFQY